LDTPQYQKPAPSPEETALAQQTAQQNMQATQADARMDTARLMAIYGTRLVMAGGTSGSPLINAPTARA
jgi:hypothetical protein